jgi:hypothetical protein
MMIYCWLKGGSMDSRDNILNPDVGRLQKLSHRVTKLLKKECKDAVEAIYVLKNTLYLSRGELIKGGIVLDNKAQLDTEITGIIDKAIKEGE